MTLDTSGPMSLMPLARYDHATQSWRTSEATSLWDLPMLLETLPAWGMTLDGELYELPMPEHHTTAQEFSSLPTPMARDYKDGSFPPRLWGPKAYMSELPTAIAVNLLPTPAVNDMGAGKDPEAWQQWAARQKAADGRPAPHGKSLEQEALKMLPTPTAQAAKQQSMNDRGPGTPDDHNLWTVVGRIGDSTHLPLSDGQMSLDELHQPQQSESRTEIA